MVSPCTIPRPALPVATCRLQCHVSGASEFSPSLPPTRIKKEETEKKIHSVCPGRPSTPPSPPTRTHLSLLLLYRPPSSVTGDSEGVIVRRWGCYCVPHLAWCSPIGGWAACCAHHRSRSRYFEMVVPDHSDSSASSDAGKSFYRGQTNSHFFFPPTWVFLDRPSHRAAGAVSNMVRLSVHPRISRSL